WLWLSVCRISRQILWYVLGDRSKKSCRELIKNTPADLYCTDHWDAYKSCISKGKLVQSKAETFNIESINSLFRHYLAGLHRRTKCISKSVYMLEISIKFF
ncbi:MAG: IS1 family transposase, partial [Candidatus Caenarcaniphilales bacterium]|nr:IS1 family transposase [Candidatus Caenarcaniphilales bacterium]